MDHGLQDAAWQAIEQHVGFEEFLKWRDDDKQAALTEWTQQQQEQPVPLLVRGAISAIVTFFINNKNYSFVSPGGE